MSTHAKHGHAPVPHFQVVPLKHLQRRTKLQRQPTHDGAGAFTCYAREWSCREAADGIPEWSVDRSGIPSWVFINTR
jgi:hypothetical protein